MDVGPYYLGSFSQVSHLMENTHHRVKKKICRWEIPGKKSQCAASHISPGEEPPQPSRPIYHHTQQGRAAPLHRSEDTPPRRISHWTIKLGCSQRTDLSCNLSQKATPEHAPLKPGGKPKRKQTLDLTQERGGGDSCNSEVKIPGWWLQS